MTAGLDKINTVEVVEATSFNFFFFFTMSSRIYPNSRVLRSVEKANHREEYVLQWEFSAGLVARNLGSNPHWTFSVGVTL